MSPDGILEDDFNVQANSDVFALVVQADGKILVGGGFSMLGGQPRNGLGRLNPDGTLDNAFNPQAEDDGPFVYSLALQPDGKILVGGSFTTLGGQPRNRIARLNLDGTLDVGFNPGATGYSGESYVGSLVVQADGKISVGGRFSTLGGQSRINLGRLTANGSLDTGFNPGSMQGGNYYVYVSSIALQVDGKILVSGSFTTLGGQPRRNLARLNPDGSLDSGFYPGATGYSGSVASLLIQPDGKILVGGSFSMLGGQPRQYLGRLNNSEAAVECFIADGSSLTWLRAGSSPEVWRTTFDSSVDGIAWTPMGAGMRIFGGWQVFGFDMPTGGTLRARGYLSGGYRSASSWFTEAYYGRPVLLGQPPLRIQVTNATISFNAAARGSEPLYYQWCKDGAPLRDGENISGTTTATLTLTKPTSDDAGDYNVTVNNWFGSVTSGVRRFSIVSLGIRMSAGLPVLEIRGIIATPAVLEYQPDLAHDSWKTLFPLVPNRDTQSFTDYDATNFPRRLYRLRGEP